MAKLIIYRGDVLDREIELGERNARIGRSDDNEIVLTDPTKSVSRLHAELRFDQGKYSVVDLKSQNGIWVSGRRVPAIDLEPGVAVILGSYKLVLKDERPPVPEVIEATQFLSPAAAATILMSVPSAAKAAANAATSKPAPSVATPKPVPAPEAAPEPKPAPRPAAADMPKPAPNVEAPPPPKPAPPPPPAPKPPPPAPALPPPPAAAPVKPAAIAKPAGQPASKTLVFAGLALLLLGGGAALLFLTPIGSRLMGNKQEPATNASSAPVTPPPVVTPPVVTPPVVAPPAPERVAPPPAPEKVVRGTVKPSAEKPSTLPEPAAPPRVPVSPPRAPRPLPVVQSPPADPVQKPVIPDLTGAFEEARAAMIKGDYLAAIAGFQAVLKGDPNYPNAQNLLGLAQSGAKNASQLAVDSGNKAEMARDYATARKQYDRALQLDPDARSAKDAISRLVARMQGEGEATYARAKQFDDRGLAQDAISEYEKALLLLPADHASAKLARERLAVLKREVYVPE